MRLRCARNQAPTILDQRRGAAPNVWGHYVERVALRASPCRRRRHVGRVGNLVAARNRFESGVCRSRASKPLSTWRSVRLCPTACAEHCMPGHEQEIASISRRCFFGWRPSRRARTDGRAPPTHRGSCKPWVGARRGSPRLVSWWRLDRAARWARRGRPQDGPDRAPTAREHASRVL